ncbi:MAG: hypothetical protein R2730_08605 [Chitinophagales bacterium]
MARMIYRTEQRYRRPEVVGLLALFTVLLAYKALAALWISNTSFGITEFLLLAILFCLGWIFLFSFKMGIRISNNSLKVKYNLFKIRSKFEKQDIDYLEFVEVPETDLWNGMTVHFESSYKAHGLGDNSGLHIRLKSGEDVYIYSNALYDDKEEITNQLKAAGWNIRR